MRIKQVRWPALVVLAIGVGCTSADKSDGGDGTTGSTTTGDPSDDSGDDGSTGGDDSGGDDGESFEDIDWSSLNGDVPAAPAELPDFVATNYDSASRSREDLLGDPTVMWFYPAAATSG